MLEGWEGDSGVKPREHLVAVVRLGRGSLSTCQCPKVSHPLELPDPSFPVVQFLSFPGENAAWARRDMGVCCVTGGIYLNLSGLWVCPVYHKNNYIDLEVVSGVDSFK